MLLDNDIRVELDDRDEKMNYKIRESVTRKIPFTLILGDKERDNNTISYRKYGSDLTETLDDNKFVEFINNLIINKK